MIFTVRLGAIEADVESEDDMTPEQSEDYLNRCSRVVTKIYEQLPDAEPATTDGE